MTLGNMRELGVQNLIDNDACRRTSLIDVWSYQVSMFARESEVGAAQPTSQRLAPRAFRMPQTAEAIVSGSPRPS
jgi:hypothetical protein